MQSNWPSCETVPAAFFNMSHYPYCKRRSTLSLSHHRYLLSTRNSELTCERQKKCKCRNEGKRRRCAPSLPRLRLSHIIRDDRKKGDTFKIAMRVISLASLCSRAFIIASWGGWKEKTMCIVVTRSCSTYY